jgi:VWFA-related protein
VVTQKSGQPVTDLQQQDFTLLDNKAPQTITSFKAVSAREAQVAVILVMDAVNTGYAREASARSEIDKFLRTDGGHLAYPTALAMFTDTGVQMEGNSSTDGNALSASLDRESMALRTITGSSNHGDADRYDLSLQALGQLVSSVTLHPGRKLMLWVSPGWPLLAGPRVNFEAKQQRRVFAEVVSLSTQLLQARITLFCVDPMGASENIARESDYQAFLKGISKPNQVQPGNLGLQVLAIQSGGQVFTGSNDPARLLQECVSAYASYYEISFDAPAAEWTDEYHHLEIKLAKRGLIAHTRQGYYAEP